MFAYRSLLMRKCIQLACIPLFALVCLSTPVHAGLFSSGPAPEGEILPTQYASLLSLRDMSPKMFRTKLLPLIEKYMQDGKISNAELAELEKAAGNVSKDFLKAAKAPSMQESFEEAMDAAGKKGNDLGDKLNETLSRDLPRLFDDTMKLFREKTKPSEPASPQQPGSVEL